MRFLLVVILAILYYVNAADSNCMCYCGGVPVSASVSRARAPGSGGRGGAGGFSGMSGENGENGA
jgi:hypothetical protein